MKRVFLSVVLIAALSTATFAKKLVAEGPTYTALGNYRIELADNPEILNGEACKTYLVTYQNSPLEVKVVVSKEKNCKKYLTMSDQLSVQYVCNDMYFGVEKIAGNLEKDGLRTSDMSMNRSEYFHQKIISPGHLGEVEATQLIAAFFPRLISENSGTVGSF